MKDWMCWTLLILGIFAIIALCWWLIQTLSVMTCIYITIVVNGIVLCYNMMQSKIMQR